MFWLSVVSELLLLAAGSAVFSGTGEDLLAARQYHSARVAGVGAVFCAETFDGDFVAGLQCILGPGPSGSRSSAGRLPALPTNRLARNRLWHRYKSRCGGSSTRPSRSNPSGLPSACRHIPRQKNGAPKPALLSQSKEPAANSTNFAFHPRALPYSVHASDGRSNRFIRLSAKLILYFNGRAKGSTGPAAPRSYGCSTCRPHLNTGELRSTEEVVVDVTFHYLFVVFVAGIFE